MDTPEEKMPPKAEFRSLADRVVKYDLNVMRKEAEYEFDASIANRDLVDQRAIGSMFNLKERAKNARN